ncbi:MAG TPA: DUF6152 family protein [Gammaproteobacteria bacterium]|jgi:hypothetical protein
MHETRTTLRVAAAAVCLAALVAGRASAHHPVLGKFDAEQPATLEGIVTKLDWRNPHAHIFMNVQVNGETQNWAVEIESPAELNLSGWNRDSLAPGDGVIVDGMLARDGSRQIWGSSVRRASNNQLLFTLDPDFPALPKASRPAPRWPDGQVALGATSGASDGYWGYPTETALVEDGVSVTMSSDGQLADIGDADEVAPLQPWALALYEHRQRRFLQDDPMFLNCKPPGGPRQYQSRLGLQLIEDRERERVFVLLGSGNRNYRLIHLDDREQVGQVGGDDDNPLYYGRSVGEWDGDTLVASAVGFNEDFWFSNGGLPHTNQLSLTERFTRVDYDTLRYEVTIDDPGAYTRPWSASWELSWVGGEPLPVHICQENRP